MSSTINTDNSYTALLAQLEGVMLADYRPMADRLRRLRDTDDAGAGMADLASAMQNSQQRAQQRQARFSNVSVNADLPIASNAMEIIDSIRANPVTIIAGATGSGKTTQIPKLCLLAGLGVKGTIAHTQPRRIAARAVADRIAEEMQTAIGDGVGYKIRFSDQTGPNCQVKLLTDGMLLQETQRDATLSEYDCIIVDEAHERSLNIDFLLGILHKLMATRPQLRIVITSATINPIEFSEFFDNAPIIEVSGRGYPIDIEYDPLQKRPLEEAIYESVNRLWETRGAGSVLVFLPGEREIREAIRYLSKHFSDEVEILPLFARLSVNRQNRIFSNTRRRRIVLSTNVAETSLTVPGIVFVVDTGIARLSRYNYKSKLQRLEVENISRASADQRAGRCGRIKPGTCIRLYAREDFDKRDEFTDPEILRTNLASVILQMAVLKLGRIREFPFLDKPDRRFVKDGYRLLEQLEAVDDKGAVTDLGRRISRYPLDPRLGKILVEAVEDGCLGEMQIITACLSAGDPRERPWEKTEQADTCHKKFTDSASDFVTLLNIWNEWQSLPGKQKERRKWCKNNFMSYRRMLEWQDIWRQLQRVAREQGHVTNERAAKNPQLHITILKGFLDNIGERKTEHTYTGARGRVFRIFPGSGLHKRNPRWVVAAEVVQTSQVFARCVAKISPDWIEIAARHLTRNRCIDTFWSSKRACAMGVEEISLFGFVLSRRRRVHLAKYSRTDARSQFIRNALVDNDWSCNEDFVDHNEQLRRRYREFEVRMRRFMIDAEKQFDFFYERLPVEVVDRRSFRQWWRSVRPNRPDYLNLGAADIGADLKPQPAWYPDTMNVAGQEVMLTYVFDPDDPRDGVTLNLPAVLLSYLHAAQIEWLIPGWLLDKTETMFRGLQKSLRKQLMPIADQAQVFVRWAIVEELPGGEESFGAALSRFVKTEHGLAIAPEQWPLRCTLPWMRMGVALLDNDGKEIAWDRDLDQLSARHGHSTVISANHTDSEWLRRDVKSWDFEQIPEAVKVEQGGVGVNVCPALVDKKHRVDMELLPTLADTEVVHGKGVCRLIAVLLHDKIRYLEKNLAELSRINILYLQIGEGESVYDDLVMAALSNLIPDAYTVRTSSAFSEQLAKCRAALIGEVQKSSALILSILTQRQKLLMLLDAEKNRFSPESFTDLRQQLDDLVYAGFVLKTPPQWLVELPRYFQAQEIRAQKIINSGKEPDMAQDVMDEATKWRSLAAEQREEKPDYQWMVEEWRVSVFAQHLGTKIPVSRKRIDKYLGR